MQESQRHEESLPDHSDTQLESLSKQLWDSIQKAKWLYRSCKIGNYQDSQYVLTPSGDVICPEYKCDINYNEQFWKKYLKNQINFALIKDISEKIGDLEKQVKEVQAISQEYQKLYRIKNRKKNRRLAVQIQKSYNCPYQNCYRVYGSDVSLNLHIKLKHGGGNKTDRQKLAQQICLAQQRNFPLPQMKFNLPQGFLQVFDSLQQEYRIAFRQRHSVQKQGWSALQQIQ